MPDQDTLETFGHMADRLSARLADQIERLTDEDSSDWSANERVRRVWIVAECWPSEDLLRDAVALVAGRTKLRWSPANGVYDGLVRLAFPFLEAQRLAEVIKAAARIGLAAQGKPGADLTKRRLAMLEEVGGVSRSARKRNRLSKKRLDKVAMRMDRRVGRTKHVT